MKKSKNFRCSILSLMISALFLAGGSLPVSAAESTNALLTPDSGKSAVYTVSGPEDEALSEVAFQKSITDTIKKQWVRGRYTIEQPLLVKNPYGTNNLSVNVYFNANELSYLKYTISVEDKSIPDYTNIASTGTKSNLTRMHSYQLIGFVQGMKNKLTLELYNRKDQLIGSQTFEIDMPTLKSKASTKLTVTAGASKQPLENGLYCLFGHAKSFASNLYLYDNNGILRGEIPVEDYRSDRILFVKNDILYSNSKNSILRVNRLGQVVKEYSFAPYEFHHDFWYDEVNDKVVALVSDPSKETSEDLVAALDLSTGKLKLVVDFKNLLPQTYETAVHPDNRAKFDWLHLNSLQVIDGNRLLASSRETSTILMVKDLYTAPKVQYLLAEPAVWAGSDYEELLYQKEGSFTAQSGQHSLNYFKTPSQKDGQYYISMFNNNFAAAWSRPDFPVSAYPNASTMDKTMPSQYYCYFVDEGKKTFTLQLGFDIPTAKYTSSAQQVNNNILTCSSTAFTFGEYDNTGVPIRTFDFPDKLYTYRNFKYSFENFYFYYPAEK